MRCLGKAITEGWLATLGPRDAYFVPSLSQPRQARCVEIEQGPDGVLWFNCSCPGGYWRGEVATEPLPVSCWHAGAVLHELFEQGSINVKDGLVIWK